jgi:hypothetical protein
MHLSGVDQTALRPTKELNENHLRNDFDGDRDSAAVQSTFFR